MTRKVRSIGLGFEAKTDATTRIAREITERDSEQVAARMKRQREARMAQAVEAPPAKRPSRALKPKSTRRALG